MNSTLLETLGAIAGIGGIALGVLLLLFRDVIRKNIFPNLTRDQGYRIIRLFLILTFLIALAGIVAWAWSITSSKEERANKQHSREGGQFRRVYYEGFNAEHVQEKNASEKPDNPWLVGARSDWRGQIKDNVHTLCNVPEDPTASFTNRLRYYPSESNKNPAELGNSKVTVKVKLKHPLTTHSGAGILFRKREKKPGYYAFIVNPGNNVSLMQNTGDKLRILWSGEIPDVKPGTFVKLKMIGYGSELQLYINDNLLHIAKNLKLTEGDPGIMAYSTGCFTFDDFSIYQRLS